jgi:hypothetical protein
MTEELNCYSQIIPEAFEGSCFHWSVYLTEILEVLDICILK